MIKEYQKIIYKLLIDISAGLAFFLLSAFVLESLISGFILGKQIFFYFYLAISATLIFASFIGKNISPESLENKKSGLLWPLLFFPILLLTHLRAGWAYAIIFSILFTLLIFVFLRLRDRG